MKNHEFKKLASLVNQTFVMLAQLEDDGFDEKAEDIEYEINKIRENIFTPRLSSRTYMKCDKEKCILTFNVFNKHLPNGIHDELVINYVNKMPTDVWKEEFINRIEEFKKIVSNKFPDSEFSIEKQSNEYLYLNKEFVSYEIEVTLFL